MPTDNISLEEMVEKTLESTGVLPKLRAELRANVFQVIEKGSSFQNKLYTDKIQDFVSNKNGLLLLSLVKDLLEYLELTFTTSVFDPETGAGRIYQCIDKDEICNKLSLSKDDKKPLLLQILQTYHTQSVDDGAKEYTALQQHSKIYDGSSLAQILKNSKESANKIIDNKPKSTHPVKTKLFEESKEQNTQFDSHENSDSLSSSDNLQLKELESSESSNSLSIEQLSPVKSYAHIEKNDNLEEDIIKSDTKNIQNDSSLEDVVTEESISCGKDSSLSTDLSTNNDSPEIIKTRNLHL